MSWVVIQAYKRDMSLHRTGKPATWVNTGRQYLNADGLGQIMETPEEVSTGRLHAFRAKVGKDEQAVVLYGTIEKVLKDLAYLVIPTSAQITISGQQVEGSV